MCQPGQARQEWAWPPGGTSLAVGEGSAIHEKGPGGKDAFENGFSNGGLGSSKTTH